MYRINVAYRYLSTIYVTGLIHWIATFKPEDWGKIQKLETIDTNNAMMEMVRLYQISLKEFLNMPAFDFTGVETQTQVALGDYRVRCVHSELKTTQGGNQQFWLKLQVINPCAFTGVVINDNLVCSQAALGRLKGALDALQLTTPGVNEMIQVEAHHFVGRECDIRIEDVVDKRDNSSKPGIGWDGYLLPGVAQYAPAAAVPSAPAVAVAAAAPVAPAVTVAPAAPALAPPVIADIVANQVVAPTAPAPMPAATPVAPAAAPIGAVPAATPVAPTAPAPVPAAPIGAVQAGMNLKDPDVPF